MSVLSDADAYTYLMKGVDERAAAKVRALRDPTPIYDPPPRAFYTRGTESPRQIMGPPVELMLPIDRAKRQLQAAEHSCDTDDEQRQSDRSEHDASVQAPLTNDTSPRTAWRRPMIRRALDGEGPDPGWDIPDARRVIEGEEALGRQKDPRASAAAIATDILSHMQDDGEVALLSSISTFWTEPLKTLEKWRKTLHRIDSGAVPPMAVNDQDLHGSKFKWGVSLETQREINVSELDRRNAIENATSGTPGDDNLEDQNTENVNGDSGYVVLA